MIKTCNKCGRELPLTEYHKRKEGKGGVQAKCRSCCKEYHSNFYKANKDRFVERQKHYNEENKEKIAERQKRYYEKNKDKIIERHKQYQAANKDKYKEWSKQWEAENPEKRRIYWQRREARKKNLPFTLTPDQWETIKKEFDSKCAYCGKKGTLGQEHFIPLTKGGEYAHSNIIPACGSCNSSKRDKDFFEWYPSQDFYNKRRELKILKHLRYNGTRQQLTIIL